MTMYEKFWSFMADVTESKSMTAEAKAAWDEDTVKRRTETFLRQADSLYEIMGEIKKAESESAFAKQLLGRLGPAVSILRTAAVTMKLSAESIRAAEDARGALIQLQSQAYKHCKSTATGDDDQYMICVASYDRQYQQHAVQGTLAWDNKDSWVRNLWARWKTVILDLLT